jgi:hypothetical protein
MTWIKSTIFFLILVTIAFPTVQKVLNIVTSKGLEGYFEPSIRPMFSLADFKSGAYQAKMTPHLERRIGFHDDFTRIFNQVDYSLFSIPHAARIIVGKHKYLQADSHVDAFLGKDFVGKRYIDDKVSRLKYLQEYFWKKKGIHLLVVFAPGKGYYYPESIPDRFLKGDTGITNNDYYSFKLQENGINLIDFNKWLMQMKDTSRYNLYPKTGAHWSCYGAWLCADSLIRYLETRLNHAIPHMVLDSLVLEPEARKEDDDMDRVLNLIWKIPVPAMTYPVFHHEYDSVAPKPPVLFISDSFYWYWQYNGIIKNTFQREDMWYYDKEVYPEQYTKPTNTAQIDLDSAINRQKVIILMQTNAGYGNLGYGFVDRAYEFYYPGKTQIKKIEENFRANPAWMEQMKEKAKAQNLPLDAMVRNDATYLYNSELKRISKHK